MKASDEDDDDDDDDDNNNKSLTNVTPFTLRKVLDHAITGILSSNSARR
jgi:hypothetical protein